MDNFVYTCFARDNFGSVDVTEKAFGARNFVRNMMLVEAALARVQARLGIIPQEAADEITKNCDINLITGEQYVEQMEIVGTPVVALVRLYKDLCAGDAGQYIHYATTTQDITDTALVLQMRDAWKIIREKTVKLRDLLEERCEQYRDLVCIGRTNDQQALPITMGFKFATWVDALNRSIQRMDEAEKRIMTLQFGGAVGTLAALNGRGVEVLEELAKELDLTCPDVSWFATRDRLIEYTSVLAILTTDLGRIGNEVYINSKSEIGEIVEGQKAGSVGSSTMPHKRNPFVACQVAAFGRSVRSTVQDIMNCAEGTNERDSRTLSAENYALDRVTKICDAALDKTLNLVSNMEIHNDAIERNLNLLHGLIFTEALMMYLSDQIGRIEAHDIIHELSMEAIANNVSITSLILADPRLAGRISEEEIIKIMNPADYVGESSAFIDRVLHK